VSNAKPDLEIPERSYRIREEKHYGTDQTKNSRTELSYLDFRSLKTSALKTRERKLVIMDSTNTTSPMDDY